MDIAEGMEIIKNGWVQKPAGFRVKFQERTEDGITEVYSPPIGKASLKSDVTAWRYAWKLWQSTQKKASNNETGGMYNITVVDEEDAPVRFYGSGEFKIYNQGTPA